MISQRSTIESFSILIVLLSLPLLALSQSSGDKKRGAIIAKKNPLVVLLESEESNYVASLKKEKNHAELKKYREGIERYNTALKEAVEALWTFSEEIRYVEAKDYLVYEKQNRRGLVVLVLSTDGSSGDWSMREVLNDRDRGKNFIHSENLIPRLIIKVYGMDGSLAVAPLPEGDLSAGNLGVGLLDIQAWLENWSKGKMLDPTVNRVKGNEALLKDYTLVIRKDHIDEKLKLNHISGAYPYPVKVVEEDEFNDLVLKQVPKHAILYPWKISGSVGSGHYGSENSIVYIQSILAPDSRKFLGIGMPKVALSGTSGGFDTVKKKHLKGYASSAKK